MKRLFSLLLVLVLLLSFTGCKALDDARAAQAFYEQDGSILWNGVRYLPLPEADNVYPAFDYTASNLLHVTEPDVPVLLSAFMGDMFNYSTDKTFLQPNEWNLYCRADLFDAVQYRILNGFEYKKYGYWYYQWDDETYDYTEKSYILSDDQIDAVYEVIQTQVPQEQSSVVSLEYDHLASVMGCSDDLLFREYLCDVLYHKETYYVVQSNENNYLIYEVPFSSVSVFEEILRAQIQADESYEDEWDEF